MGKQSYHKCPVCKKHARFERGDKGMCFRCKKKKKERKLEKKVKNEKTI